MQSLTDSEITELCVAKLRLHEDVVRLEVAVDRFQLCVQVVQSLQDILSEASNYQLRNQWLLANLLRRVIKLLLDGDDVLQAAAVHVLHHEVDLPLVDVAAVVAHEHGLESLNHVELVVELVSLIFAEQIDHLDGDGDLRLLVKALVDEASVAAPKHLPHLDVFLADGLVLFAGVHVLGAFLVNFDVAL